MQLRLEDLVEDHDDLYDEAPRIYDNVGNGSWEGHVNFHRRRRNELRTSIAQADATNCPVPDYDREIAAEEPPT